MIYVNIELNGVWIQHFPLKLWLIARSVWDSLSLQMAQADQASQQVGEPPLLIDIPIVHTWSTMHQWRGEKKTLAMTVLQFTKHKSAGTLRLCDVCSAEMKLTVFMVYYGVISHWVTKSFDNCSILRISNFSFDFFFFLFFWSTLP